MGYQAVLFCPDEKLARVVSQVFDEVDFVIEPVNDPFATVKKLMAQHYDAIVVDCEDQQNGSLLFNSAHNSPFNQNSLAIALVEGQAGVAHAYRIGANLVLTKPINVEQAKGTLRVARGLLRKSADATAAAAGAMTRGMPIKEAPAALTHLVETEAHDAPVAAPAIPADESGLAVPFAVVSAPTPPLPSLEALAKAAGPARLPMPSGQGAAPAETRRTMQTQPPVWTEMSGNEAAKTELSKPVLPPVLAAATREAAAAAPAPAKEAAKQVEMKPAKKEDGVDASLGAKKVIPADVEEGLSYKEGLSNSLSFAAFREQEADGPRGSKKSLIAAVVFLSVAGAAYFGWSTFVGSPSVATPRPAATVEQHPVEPAADLAPMSLPSPAPAAAGRVNRQSTSSSSLASKHSQPQTGKRSSSASSDGLAVSAEPTGKEPQPKPIQVRADTAALKTEPQAEAVVQPPSPLGVQVPDNINLSGLVQSEANVPKPTLAQIRVSQGVSQGLLIKSVQPKYPAKALASHAQGAVQIEATIDKEGNVVHPKVLSGNSVLATAALDAVRQWRYKPYSLNGEPVEIQTQITINFKAN